MTTFSSNFGISNVQLYSGDNAKYGLLSKYLFQRKIRMVVAKKHRVKMNFNKK